MNALLHGGRYPVPAIDIRENDGLIGYIVSVIGILLKAVNKERLSQYIGSNASVGALRDEGDAGYLTGGIACLGIK